MWDTFILMLATYNSYQVLYQDAFEPLKVKSLAETIVSVIVDIIYVIDIVLMFFTSVIDNQGKENFDTNLIAYRRIYSLKFYTELASVLGTDIIAAHNKYLKPFALMKTLRILKLGTMIS